MVQIMLRYIRVKTSYRRDSTLCMSTRTCHFKLSFFYKKNLERFIMLSLWVTTLNTRNMTWMGVVFQCVLCLPTWLQKLKRRSTLRLPFCTWAHRNSLPFSAVQWANKDRVFNPEKGRWIAPTDPCLKPNILWSFCRLQRYHNCCLYLLPVTLSLCKLSDDFISLWSLNWSQSCEVGFVHSKSRAPIVWEVERTKWQLFLKEEVVNLE